MNAYDRQRELELTSVTRGVERYMRALRKDQDKGREFDTSVGQKVISRMIKLMLPAVVQLQRAARKKLVEAQMTGRRITGWEMPVAASDPESLAYIAIRSVVTQDDRTSPKHQLARRIGRIANLELRWEELRTAERKRAKEDKNDPPNRIEMLKRTVKQINPKSLRKWLRKLDDLTTTEWSNEEALKVGLVLIDLMVETCAPYIIIETAHEIDRGRHANTVRIHLRPEVRAFIDNEHKRIAEDSPWLLPMVCPPRPWAWDGQKYVGGYLTHDMGLIKSVGHTHTVGILSEGTAPPVVLAALSAIDNTEWRINADVLDVASEAERQGRKEVLPVEPARPLPANIDAETWAKMAKEERGAVRRQRRIVHDHNHRLESKRETLRRVLRVADEFVQEPVIYFPHSLDFRGRAYPLPQDLNPQGDDFAKGLLKFARAKRLGPKGLLWLCYHAANTYGMDKLSRADQTDWVIAHLDDLHLVSSDPLGAGYAFWSKAEEPWQFLAVAMELERAFANEEGPEEFASSLPVFVDGSCNGLQHLSAMGLDPIGAHATNLTNDPMRQDIYQIVADKVSGRVDQDTPAWHDGTGELAWNWKGHVSRKVVKRGVMTVPYGLTDIGMRDQLIADHWTDDLDGDAMKNATYLRDLMKEAIGDTVVKATEIMGWMQDNAHILASNGVPVDWTAPSGFSVRQAYYNRKRKRITTLIGETYTPVEMAGASLNIRKQVLSIAPNIIHSFDAAHMTLTIAAAHDAGFRDFAVIHDSFGCHAARMDEFLHIVREEFVKIYRENWFENLQREFQASVGDDVPLLPPPERGSFDIEQVRDAQFFFA